MTLSLSFGYRHNCWASAPSSRSLGHNNRGSRSGELSGVACQPAVVIDPVDTNQSQVRIRLSGLGLQVGDVAALPDCLKRAGLSAAAFLEEMHVTEDLYGRGINGISQVVRVTAAREVAFALQRRQVDQRTVYQQQKGSPRTVDRPIPSANVSRPR